MTVTNAGGFDVGHYDIQIPILIPYSDVKEYIQFELIIEYCQVEEFITTPVGSRTYMAFDPDPLVVEIGEPE